MAGFTAELSNPGNSQASGGGSATSGVGEIGQVIGGAAGIFDKVLGHLRENDAADAGNDVAKQLTQLVQNNFGQNPDGTKLVGEAPADPNAAAAAQSPIVKSTLGQLDRLSQANSQGSLNPTELFTRGSVIVQDAINQNPLFATEIRQAAQAVLGTQPTTALVQLAEEDANRQKAANAEVQHSLVMSSANAGVTYLNADGTFDFDKMATAGTAINYQDKIISDATKQAQLDAAKAGPAPTDSDKLNAEISPFIGGANPVFAKVQDGMLSSVPALIARLNNQGKPEQTAQVLQAIGVQQTTFNTWLDGQIVKNNISPKAAEQIHQYYNSFFDNYKTLASGDLSAFATNAAALKAMETNGQMAFRDSAPAMARLHDMGGDQAVTAVINVAVGRNGPLQDALNADVSNSLVPPASTGHVVNNTTSALGGGYQVASEQDPDTQRRVLAGVVGTYNAYNTKGTLDGQEKPAYGHATNQITALGLSSNDPENLRHAADLTNTPAATSTFRRWLADRDNAGAAPLAAQGVIALNTKAVLRGLPVVAQGQSVDLGTSVVGLGTRQDLAAGTAASATHVTGQVSAAYNPITGRVELSVTGHDDKGQPVALSQQQMSLALKGSGDYRASVDSVNRSLEAVAGLKDQSLGREKDFSPLQLKQILVSGAGFPLKAGTRPVDMPAWAMKKPGDTSVIPTSVSPQGQQGPVQLPDNLDKTMSSVSLSAATRVGVDPDALETLSRAVLSRESGGNLKAVSPTGVHGLMQVTQNVAKTYGQNRDDPVGNITAGINYLADLLKRTKGDVGRALMMYNGGGDHQYVSHVAKFLPAGSNIYTLFNKGEDQ